MHAPPPSCERFRLSLSLALDGELSELEQAALDAHLRNCVDCGAYARGAGALTTALRAAPLEPIELPLAHAPRRRLPRPAFVAAAAAVVALAIGLGSLAGTLSRSGPPKPSRTSLAERSRPLIEQQVLALDLAGPARRPGGGRAIPQ